MKEDLEKIVAFIEEPPVMNDGEVIPPPATYFEKDAMLVLLIFRAILLNSEREIPSTDGMQNGKDLHISVTLPCIEVGTIGGGTQLASQVACLNLLGVKDANSKLPGANSQCLARIVAVAVLPGELLLMSALAAGHLVKSYMKYNRTCKDIPSRNLSAGKTVSEISDVRSFP